MPKVADHPEWIEAAEAAYLDMQQKGGNIQACAQAYSQKIADLAVAEVTSQHRNACVAANDPPIGWAEDALTGFLDQAHRNRWATFARLPSPTSLLKDIAALFVGFSRGWMNPANEVAALVSIRATSAFFAAAQHALAGQEADIFPSSRACVEYAAYALFMIRRPDATEVWVRRHDSAEAFSAVRRVFTHAAVAAEADAADPWVGELYRALYQEAIDFGAHPNERAVTSNARMVRTEQGREIQQVLLHDTEEDIQFGLAHVAEVGICALTVLSLAFPDRILGERAAMLAAMRALVDALRCERPTTS